MNENLINSDVEQPTYFENHDLDNIVTPVDVRKLEFLLKQSKYDAQKTSFLINGF